MSGHSKWATIKHRKGAADAKRAASFTKLIREVEVAAREKGPDPAMNFRLRLAMDRARSANVPKDNIERAVARGSGAGGEVQIEATRYEAYGPGGAGLIIECLTDNRNRTANEVKLALSKNGGSFAAPGSVAFQFENKGVVRAGVVAVAERDSIELELIDAGAEDIRHEEDETVMVGAIGDLAKLSETANRLGLAVKTVQMEWLPKNLVAMEDGALENLCSLVDTLEGLDDVQAVFTNAE